MSPTTENDDRLFRAAWKDAEGMSFIGLPTNEKTTLASQNKKGPKENVNSGEKIDFAEIYDDELGDDLEDIDEERLNELRMSHGGDPFPLAVNVHALF